MSIAKALYDFFKFCISLLLFIISIFLGFTCIMLCYNMVTEGLNVAGWQALLLTTLIVIAPGLVYGSFRVNKQRNN